MQTRTTDKQRVIDALDHHPRRVALWRSFDATPLSEPEMIAFSMLACALVLTRDAELALLRAYVAEPHNRLPFEGCERALFDTLIAALRERGRTADEIADFIELQSLIAGVAMMAP